MKTIPAPHRLQTAIQAVIARSRLTPRPTRTARLRRGRLAALGAVLLLLVALLPSASMVSAVSGTWMTTSNMITARYYHTATLLANGQVLVAGGYNNGTTLSSAELYNPTTGAWAQTGSMVTARYYHTATLLPNGQVLVAGGYNNNNNTYLASAELYNPSTGTWASTGNLNTARYYHTATLLSNGQVLVAGGYNNSTGYLASAELYDPSTGTWTATGSMNVSHAYHAATLLANGQVLVTGGCSSSCNTSSAELYNPSAGTWTTTGSMNVGRYYHTATLLANGQVLVAGGYGSPGTLSSAELYDPNAGTWTVIAPMGFARTYHTATLLPNGQVLVAGGYGTNGYLSSTELFNPTTGTWTATGSLNTARYLHAATLLPSGQVLVTGGTGPSGYLSSAELYVPDTTPPTTAAVLSPPANAAGWNNSSTQVTLNAADNPGGSGVSLTYYAVDNSSCAPGNIGSCSTYSSPLSFTSEGQHTVYFFSQDLAGNTETQKSAAVNIDETPPNAPTLNAGPAPNSAGWNNSPVTVRFSSNGDAGSVQSGVASCTSPITISAETAGTVVSGTCTDNAGNVSTPATTTVMLDQTPPHTTASLAGTATGCGTYYAPVTETLSANDNLSGVAGTTYQIDGGTMQSYTAPFSLTALGAHTVTYASTDVAGNAEATQTSSVTLVGPPALAGSLPGANYGTTVALTGSNFIAGEMVAIYWDSTATTPLAMATVGANCTVNAGISVPQATFGKHTLIAVGQMSGQPASLPFIVIPKTSLSATSGPQSSLSVITGYGFAAHEKVLIHWASPSGQMLGGITTNSLGTFNGSGLAFTVPISPTGVYRVYAVGQTSHVAPYSFFRVTPLLSIAPTNGTAGSSASVGATGYGAHETVTVKWDCASPSCPSTTVLLTATTDGNGDLSSHTVTIPAGAGVGTHTVGAIGKTSHAFTTTSFTVNP